MIVNRARVRHVLRQGLPWELNAVANLLNFGLAYLGAVHIPPGPMAIGTALASMIGHMIVQWLEDGEREHPIPGALPDATISPATPTPTPVKGTTP